MCKGNCLWLAALFRNIEAACFCGMALMLAPFTEQRLAQCDLRCGDRRAGLGICSKQDGCGAAVSCPSFQAFRSWTRVRHLSYGRCETNNPQSRCLEGAGQVLSLLGVNRRTLICQYQRINWTRKALLFSHAGSLHGAAGSVRFTSACLTLQSNLVLDVNPGEVPAFTALRNDWSGKANTRHSRPGRVDFESLQSRCDLVFAPSTTSLAQLPYAPAKLAVARDHFTLQTAESEPALPPDIPLQAGQVVEQSRRSRLLWPLCRGRTGDPAAQQTFHAGVSKEALAEIAASVRPPAAMPRKALPAPRGWGRVGRRHSGIWRRFWLSGSTIQGCSRENKILGEMQKEKKSGKDRSLEAILDRAEGGSAKESGSGSRSKVAALRSLQGLLKSSPALVYSAVEKHLQMDSDRAGAMPGITSSNVTVRGWLEHKSRNPELPLLYQSGLVHSRDMGCSSWRKPRATRPSCAGFRHDGSAGVPQTVVVAGVGGDYRPPDAWESPDSALVDTRRELFMDKLKEIADYREKKGMLGGQARAEVASPCTNAIPISFISRHEMARHLDFSKRVTANSVISGDGHASGQVAATVLHKAYELCSGCKRHNIECKALAA